VIDTRNLDVFAYVHADHSHFEKVIQLLQTEAEEESRQDDVDGDPTTVSQDAANGNEVPLPNQLVQSSSQAIVWLSDKSFKS